MFDSAGGDIPAGAQVILLPSDGRYAAGNAAVAARFPHATYQTYSALGQVPAEWIDVEPGCVWPPAAAVALWRSWDGNGVTRGFYCARSTRTVLAGILAPADHPEWFEADPTGVPHVLAGDAETQWGWFGGFDESELAAAPVIVHGPVPVPAPASNGDIMILRDTVTGGYWVALASGAVDSYEGAPYLGGANNPAANAAGHPCVGIMALADGGYTLVLDTGVEGPARFPHIDFPRTRTS
jgi:hypothetical protein